MAAVRRAQRPDGHPEPDRVAPAVWTHRPRDAGLLQGELIKNVGLTGLFCTSRSERESHPGGKQVISIQKNKPEQIVTVLRQIEVQMANGKTVPPSLQGSRNSHPDVLSMAEGVRRSLRVDQVRRLKELETGEWPTEEVGSRSGVGPCDSAGDILGKLLSPPRRRQAVKHVCQAMGVSERRALSEMRGSSPPRSASRNSSNGGWARCTEQLQNALPGMP